MTFENEKKTFLEKIDKSKKGSIDEKVKDILDRINSLKDYYTTSSCSGRVTLWRGSGKKNEREWLKVSHDLIDEDFFKTDETGEVWLRFEGFIIHICCRDLDKAEGLLKEARKIYRRSNVLSFRRKIIVEIIDNTILEMPFFKDGKKIFCGDEILLKELINSKFTKNWKKMERFLKTFD